MWLTQVELDSRGFASLGIDVKIDEGARIIGAERIHIGDHSRIDTGALLTTGAGTLRIGRHVHISSDAKVIASSADVTLSDFCGLSSGVCVFSATDDYTGGSLTNPTVPADLKDLKVAPVVLGPHVIVGANSVVLPGVTLAFGASVGALTVVDRDLARGQIAFGNPLQILRFKRDCDRLAALEAELAAREAR